MGTFYYFMRNDHTPLMGKKKKKLQNKQVGGPRNEIVFIYQ